MNISDRSQHINVSGVGNSVGPGATTNNYYVNDVPLSEEERSACLAAYRQQMLNDTAFVSFAGLPNDPNNALLRMPLEKIFIPVQLLSQEKSKEAKHQEYEAALQNLENPLSRLEQYRRLGEYLYRHKPLPTRKKQNETFDEFVNRIELESTHKQESEKNDAYTAYQKHQRLVFLGPPGAGKSTVLRYVAHKLLSQNPQTVAILVRLRDYATSRTHDLSLSLRDFALNEAAAGNSKLRRALAELEKPIWLLDALDEAHGWQTEITKQANQLPGDLILTSRPLNYQPGSLLSLPHYELQALKLEDIEQFLRNWYIQLAKAKSQPRTWADERVIWLQKQLETRPAIQSLMSSPLLLTFLVLLAGEQPDIELPQKRADLYQRYVESLFHAWEKQRQLQRDSKGQRLLTFCSLGPSESRRLALRSFEVIAWYLHLAYYDRPNQYAPTNQALHSYLVEALKQELPTQEQDDIAQELLSFWQEAGLLSEWRLQGEIYLTFRHLTFQEYGVARQLEQFWQKNQKKTWLFLKPRLHIEHWRESLLMFGTLLPQQNQPNFAQQIWKTKSAYERTLWRNLRLLLLLWGEGIQLGNKLESQLKQLILRVCRPNSSFHTSFWLQKMDCITSYFWENNSVDEEASAYYQHILSESLYALPLIAIELFTTLLDHSNKQVKISAINQLGGLNDERIVPILEQYTNHSDEEVRQAALHMLSSKPMDFIQIKRIFKEIVETFELPESSLLTNYLGKDWHIYFEKVQNSGLVFPEDQAFFESAISMLNSSNIYIRKWGAELLGMIRDSRAYDPLVKLLLVELDKNIRDNIIDSLKKLQKNEVVEILIAEVKKNDNIPLTLIIHSLGQLGDKKALDTLLELLSHNDVQVRLSAVQALGKLDDDRAIDPLINLFKNDSATVRSAVAKSLGSLGNKRVELVLIDHLRDNDQNVRREVIGALGKIGSDKSLLPLANSLKDKDVYWAVLSILQQLPISNNKDILQKITGLLYRNLKRQIYKIYPQDNENSRIFDLSKFHYDSFFSSFLILIERYNNHYEILCLQQRPGDDPLLS